MRQPGIHVTEEQLFKALKQVMGIDVAINYRVEIVKMLQNHQLTNRQLVVMNSIAKAAKLSGRKLADKLVSMSYAKLCELRLKEHHVKLRPIRPSQPGWSDVVAAAEAAEAFTQRFNLPAETGHLTYYTTAFDVLTKSFTVRTLAFSFDKVCAAYGEMREVQQDPDKNLTDASIQLYLRLARLNQQAIPVLEKNRVHFVRAVAQAGALQVGVEPWIKCLFEAIEWTKTFPEPKHLYGEKAVSTWMATGKRGKAVTKTAKQLAYEKLMQKK